MWIMDAPGVNLHDPKVIDLIERMYYRRFSAQVEATGLDVEDGFQEVIVSISRRNVGKSPWDPRISSLSNYIFIVLRSVTHAIHEKQWRGRRRWGEVGAEYDHALLTAANR